MPGTPEPTINIVNAFFAWFKGRYQAMFALAGLSGFGLFMPECMIVGLRISGPLHNEWVRLSLLSMFGFSIVYLFIGACSGIAMRAMAEWHLRSSLSSDERNVLLSFADHDKRVQGFMRNVPAAQSLASRGVLRRCDKTFNPIGRDALAVYFVMPRWVYKKLKQNPRIYKDF